MTGFFQRNLKLQDAVVADAIAREMGRQRSEIELIASENIVSPAVLEAQGSVMTNKYAEGYPGHRYYGGCQYVDLAEAAAIDRACRLFGAAHANVQPHSGAQANGAVMLAMLKPGDTFMGLSLAAGGHLTHGARPTLSGKWFNAVQYGVRQSDCLIDYEELEAKARETRPKLIIAGGSAYPRIIDFKRIRAIADAVGALMMVDMAHFAGLVAGGVHPNPVEVADIVTTTTHKTLRGPRGGMILTNNQDIAKKLNSAVFPGLQGGPLMHVIAAKAVALGEALEDGFKTYARQMVANARKLAATLGERGFDIVSGGTDTHLLLVDLRGKGLSGKDAEEALGRAGLTCNKNGIPFDPAPPAVTSGIRLGTPAATTRGFGEGEFARVGNLIADVLDAVGTQWGAEQEKAARRSVEELCEAFPIYEPRPG
ncbi:serine hydroxymethyltransferase [Mesorhizobium sp. M7A.F.Ca.US.014.04.1.1]|uniref:Serine hydroxymethyltransferase n=2 Tax=Mesorhizobium TaxID=68287 RepID=E8TGZ7_MESCW|nr:MULTISPECIES: serine hydroxymethyltransferase [Mesorhizobium]ADV11196.1 Glycine hydroxymethyltransferase [Mesorhizobium ciceri biovar biserrulae WSM1271]AMX94555.1 serine hydroxymethyltransferase [Mesorhizobium ciceri]MDF3212056.1 serine hydroxymethyltransferase [Mesorhizobium sp. LMG15046]MDF3234581.1 serine hydroxymethyltransferase [Mesorhizobium sp. DSM 30133]RUU19573.1 serine hydroxymethyltransferase [Mesorhizobium sp. Primo-B]